MRNPCSKCLLVCAILCLAGCRTVNEIEVFISEQSRGVGLRAEPYEAYKDSFIKNQGCLSSNVLSAVDCLVVVKNRTHKEIYICDEEFEMGYYNLELELMFANNEIFHLKKRKGVWYRNLQNLQCIPPGGALSIPITLDDAIWENIPKWTEALLQKVMDDPFTESSVWDNVSLLLPGREVMLKARLRQVIRIPDSPCNDALLSSCATYETAWTRLLFREKRTIPMSECQHPKRKIVKELAVPYEKTH